MARLHRPQVVQAFDDLHPVWLLNAGIVAITVALALRWVDGYAPVAKPHLHWYLIALAVLATERWPVNLQFQRSAHSFSLTDIPLTLAVIFASGGDALVGMALGTGIALGLRRLPPIKYVFNLGQFTLGMALSLAVVHLVAGAHPAFGPRLWLGAFLASQLNGAMTITLIATAMSLSDGRLSLSAVRGMFGMDAVVTLMNTSFALIGAVIVITRPIALPLVAVPILIALAGYRAYIREHERHKKVEFLYQAGRALAESPEVAVAIEGLLRRAREAFRAEQADVVLLGSGDHPSLRTRLGPGESSEHMAVVDADAAIGLQRLAETGPVSLSGIMPAALRQLADGTPARNAMVAVLRGEERIIGTMVIANRIGLAREFTEDDLSLFETLAANASAALQFDRLERAVTELRELQHKLHHQAYHDPLTELANRALFTRRLDAALEADEAVAVLFIDLDDFKLVNDTLGHGIGDQLLCAAANRINGCVRTDALVARLGGDEFAILLGGSREAIEDLAIDVAERVVRRFRLPVSVGERMISTRLSVGIATTSHSGAVTSDLLRDADVAMYEAKSAGTGGYAVFTREMRDTVVRRHSVQEELRSGIEEDHLVLQYQPIIDLASSRIAAVEALVRWEHPERGRISPLDFVPLAESTGLIVPLGRFVLERACRQAVEWTEQGGSDVGVQVNLSARELENPELIATVREVLEQTQLEPRRLVLEITESVMIRDAAAGGETLSALRHLGVQLALDDFGTGYSSLSYMRSLPLDSLKIAKEFTDGLGHSEEDRAFVRLIIQLARMRGLRVIAEGIEDGEQLEILRGLGCDLAQGFLLARPLDADDPLLRNAVGVATALQTPPAALAPV